jgi:type II secretory pathway predicted ATPase ExeA
MHYDLIRTFPFSVDTGKVCRLFMNLLMLRNGLPPSIIHNTERQRYYDALKGSPVAMNNIVHDAMDNALQSSEKILDEYETGSRAFIT